MDLRLVDVIDGALKTPHNVRLELPKAGSINVLSDPILDDMELDLGMDGPSIDVFEPASLAREAAGEDGLLFIALPSGGVLIDLHDSKRYVVAVDKIIDISADLPMPAMETCTLADLGIYGSTVVWRMPRPANEMALDTCIKQFLKNNNKRCIRLIGCKCFGPGATDGYRNIWIDTYSPPPEASMWVECSRNRVPRVHPSVDVTLQKEVAGSCNSGACVSTVVCKAFPVPLDKGEPAPVQLLEALKASAKTAAIDVDRIIQGDLDFMVPVIKDINGDPVVAQMDPVEGLMVEGNFKSLAAFSNSAGIGWCFPLKEVQKGDVWRVIDVVKVGWALKVPEEDQKMDDLLMEDDDYHLKHRTHLSVPRDAVWFAYAGKKQRMQLFQTFRTSVKKRRGSDVPAAAASKKKRGSGGGGGATTRRRVTREDVGGVHEDYADDLMTRIEEALLDARGCYDWLEKMNKTVDPSWWKTRVVLPDFNVLTNAANGMFEGDAYKARPADELIRPLLREGCDPDDLDFGAFHLTCSRSPTLYGMVNNLWRRFSGGQKTTSFRRRNQEGPLHGSPMLRLSITESTCIVAFGIGASGEWDLHEVRVFLVHKSSSSGKKRPTVTSYNISNIAKIECQALANPRILWELGRWEQHKRIDSDNVLVKWIGKSLGMDGYLFGGVAASSAGKKVRAKAVRVRKSVLHNDAPRRSERVQRRIARTGGGKGAMVAPPPSSEQEMVATLAKQSSLFNAVTPDKVGALIKPLPKIIKAIIGSEMATATQFYPQFCVLVFWRLPYSVQVRVMSGKQCEKPIAQFDTASLLEKMDILADALNLHTLLRPALKCGSPMEMWSTLVRLNRVDLHLALSLNCYVTKDMPVLHMVDVLFYRIENNASTLAQMRVKDALEPGVVVDVARVARLMEPFSDLTSVFLANVKEGELQDLVQRAEAPFVAIGHMAKGKTTYWAWWVYVLMHSSLTANRESRTNTRALEEVLEMAEISLHDFDGAVRDRREKMVEAKARLSGDLSSVQTYINMGMGLSVVGEGVRGTSRVLTEYRPEGKLGRVELVIQRDGHLKTIPIAVDATDTDTFCAWLGEFARVVNGLDVTDAAPHDKPVRIIVYGPFPVTIIDTPGLQDSTVAVDTVVQSILATGVKNHVFHVTHIDQVISRVMGQCGEPNPLIICSANVAKFGRMKMPLEYARSDDYAQMTASQTKNYPDAATVIRGDGFVGLWHSVLRQAANWAGGHGSQVELAEEARACQVAELYDRLLQPTATALKHLGDFEELLEVNVLGSEESIVQAAEKMDLSKLRKKVAGLLDTKEEEISCHSTISDLIKTTTALVKGMSRCDHQANSSICMDTFFRHVQPLLLKRPVELLDYQACILREVEEASRQAAEELWSIEGVIKPAVVGLERYVQVMGMAGAEINLQLGRVMTSTCITAINRAFGIDGGGMPTVEAIVESLRLALVRALAVVRVDELRPWLRSNGESQWLEENVRPHLWTCLQTVGAEVLHTIKDCTMFSPSPALVQSVIDITNSVSLELRTHAAAAVEEAAASVETDIMISLIKFIRLVAATFPAMKHDPVVVQAKQVVNRDDRAVYIKEASEMGTLVDYDNGCMTAGELLAGLLGRGASYGDTFLNLCHALMPKSIQEKITPNYPAFHARCDGVMDVAVDSRERLFADLRVVAFVTGTRIMLRTNTSRVMFNPMWGGRLVGHMREVALEWVAGDRPLNVVV